MKKLILIVDDEAEVAQSVEFVLDDEGFEVSVCRDGLQAQEALSNLSPQLIISDVMMPRCDGYQLVKYVKKEKELSSIPLILMSAAPIAPDSGADAYLKKPFSIDRLLELVEKFIGKAN